MDEECHGCPDDKGAKLACLAGAQGDERAWMLGVGLYPTEQICFWGLSHYLGYRFIAQTRTVEDSTMIQEYTYPLLGS